MIIPNSGVLVKGANTFGKTFSISESRENLERSNVK
jgi:hypothetical protein